MNHVKRNKPQADINKSTTPMICDECGCEIEVGDNIWIFHDRVYCSECVEELKDDN